MTEPQSETAAKPKGDLRDEYLDASENVRHWSSLRFAQLTVFIAITAGLFAALFQSQTVPQDPIRLIMEIAGLLITAIFWIMEERTMNYWRTFIDRAAKLEAELGYHQYSSARRPGEGYITSANAIRLLFLLLGFFWIAAMIWF